MFYGIHEERILLSTRNEREGKGLLQAKMDRSR